MDDLPIDDFRRLTPQALTERGLRAREISFDGLRLPGAASDEALCFNDVVFSYGRERALEIPTLKIPCGSIVAVIGANGPANPPSDAASAGLKRKCKEPFLCGEKFSVTRSASSEATSSCRM